MTPAALVVSQPTVFVGPAPASCPAPAIKYCVPKYVYCHSCVALLMVIDPGPLRSMQQAVTHISPVALATLTVSVPVPPFVKNVDALGILAPENVTAPIS